MTPKVSREILGVMIRIRVVEETIAERYSEQEMRCPTHLSIGQEGVAAAVCAALDPADLAVSGHRAHAHYLAKGGNLQAMIGEIYGKEMGCSSGKGGSMHLVDEDAGFMGSTAIVGGTIPVGVGMAYASKLKQKDQVSVIFLGDAAVETGVFYESANFACLKKLPVLFICENNLYSVYSPLNVRQPVGRKIYRMVEGVGMHAAHGDGNKPEQVFKMAQDAITAIRAGDGPWFLEFDTYRWREHCGPFYDNDIGYRSEEEFIEWKKRDPISYFEERLFSDGTANVEQIQDIRSRINREVEKAFEVAQSAPFPAAEKAFSDLYSS